MNQKRILLVDDQPEVRETIKMVLEFGGHHVTEAGSGGEALAAFEPGKFDLVITDYAMPGMRGDELAESIKQAAPSQLVLMVSGSAEFASAEDMSSDAILHKPFQIADLLAEVSRMVSPAEASARA